MIPPDGVKGKLDGMVDSAPPDNGYEMLAEKATDSEIFAENGDTHIALK